MQQTFWQKIRYWVFLLLIFLITISSHPTIVEISKSAGIEQGTILSRYIILMFGLLFVLCFNLRSIWQLKLIRKSLFIFIWILFFHLLTVAFFGSKTMLGDARSIAICLVAIMIGWQLELEEKQYNFVLLFYAGLTLFVGLMQVLLNVGGFEILDQYHTDNKNALGVMLATSAFVFFFLFMNSKKKGFWKILLLALSVFTVYLLLTIRARAATLTFAIMVLYMLYERFKGKNFLFYLLLGLFLVTIVFLILPASVKDYVYNSFFQNYDMGNIDTGRGERNRDALNFLSYNPLFGNLKENVDVEWVHNYPLRILFQYGIVFSLPIMILYLYLLIKTVARTFKANNHNAFSIGYYALIIPFIISMAEPTFPFGPGTATVFNFILFGFALKWDYQSRNVMEFDGNREMTMSN